jgi:hypothetical protein
VKTREEVDNLKWQWVADSCWDIGKTGCSRQSDLGGIYRTSGDEDSNTGRKSNLGRIRKWHVKDGFAQGIVHITSASGLAPPIMNAWMWLEVSVRPGTGVSPNAHTLTRMHRAMRLIGSFVLRLPRISRKSLENNEINLIP